MTKKQLLNNLKDNIYCRIGKSKIHGVGVIAIRDIPKGVNPFVGSCQCDNMIFTKEDLLDLEPEIKKMIEDYYVTQNNKVFIPNCGLNRIDISYFMNHSKKPNMITNEGNIFIASRNIRKGEELTWNYEVISENYELSKII